jgi:DNA-directed RNA polymerase specialized sigma24 family protein
MDNLNTHRRKSLIDTFGEKVGGEIWDRFTVHYTPTHGSWLNQAEIEISLFARQCLGTRRIPDLKTLRRETRLESLPAKSREVMVLRELEQLSYREIASVVGVPVGTVMSRLSPPTA